MLQKTGEVFRDELDLKEEMEARVLEILVDEIGHIAFNRMASVRSGCSPRARWPGRFRGP
jgi:hypothetical protein